MDITHCKILETPVLINSDCELSPQNIDICDICSDDRGLISNQPKPSNPSPKGFLVQQSLNNTTYV